MTEIEKKQILLNSQNFFREEIVEAHKRNVVKASKLSSYNINPFLFKYLANFLEGNGNPSSIAKALMYPRALSSSITTSFGMRTQKMIPKIFEGMMGSTISGMDLEFIDALDGRKKYCQLKAGPTTINKGDVTSIINHFKGVKNQARANYLDLRVTDMIVGVLYGERSELSANYKKINSEYPVIIGQEFWHRLTGDKNFYLDISNAIGEVALEVDGRQILQETISALAKEIEDKFSSNE